MNIPAEIQKNISVPFTQQIFALEKLMHEVPEDQRLPFDNRHDFCPGMYARTIFMPAGMFCTSQIHKTQHFFVVSKGSCTVVDTLGNKTLIEAPYLGVTLPGTKRVLHIHEDCIWTTFHATDLTDVAEIEAAILADPSYFGMENSP